MKVIKVNHITRQYARQLYIPDSVSKYMIKALSSGMIIKLFPDMVNYQLNLNAPNSRIIIIK